jgi:TonB-dependent starch-binding outer membrane protein SusC
MPMNFSFLGRLCSLLLLVTLSLPALSQQKITGKVTGPDGLPVNGASIQVVGSPVGTVSQADGSFALTMPPGKTSVQISSVGFKAKTVSVSGSSLVGVVLDVDASASLNEAVVTGYTSQARKNITGAVSTVSGAKLATVQTGNAEQQFQGRVPGVTVITSGQPGTTSQVRIRGFGSFGSNEPLYVVDGVPTTNIDFLNGNDIESTTVLKDAASASIYGARAAAGVIIVTTKHGKANSGKLNVSYDVSYGRVYPGKGLDLLTPTDQATWTWTALKNAGQALSHPQYGTGATPVLPDYLKVGSESGLSGLAANDPRLDPKLFNSDLNKGAIYQVIKANKGGTNWYDALTDVAPIQNHTLSFGGGSDNAKYYAGISYYDEKGTIINTRLKRYSLRMNSEFKVKNLIRFGENFQFTFRENPNLGFSPASENQIMFALTINPLIPVYDQGGGFAGTTAKGFNNSTNPVANRIRTKDNKGFSSQIFGNLYAEADIARHFTARTSFGGDFFFFQNRFINYATYENSENVGSNTFGEGAGNGANWTWTNTLKYAQIFGKHNITALGGIEAVATSYFRGLSGSGLNPFTTAPAFQTITNTDPSGRSVNSNGAPLRQLYSQFGKVDYVYNDRFLFTGLVRRDGSSVFGANYKHGVFPAFSVGYRISEEEFMKSLTWITDLKIRGGWGKMGNERPVGTYNTVNTLSGVNGYDVSGSNTSTSPGISYVGLGNDNTKWEETTTTDIGLDGTLFNNHLEVLFDWYKRTTSGLVFQKGIPSANGGTTAARPFVNIAGMSNTGVDMMFTYKARVGAVRIEADAILTKYKNEITSVADNTDFFDVGFSGRIGGGVVRNAKGHAVSSFFGYDVIGLFKDAADVSKSPTQDGAGPGRFKYRDVDGDGKITTADRTFIGNPNPDFTYGLNLRAFYKAFDIEALFYGVQGGKVLNFTKWFTDFYPSFAGIAKSTRVLNSWTPNNQNAKVPIFENVSNFSTNGQLNSYYVEKGTYLRLRSVKLGYTVNAAALKRIGVERLRAFVQGTNLFTATKYTGLDPAVSGVDTNFGVDIGNYPVNRQVLVGISLGL